MMFFQTNPMANSEIQANFAQVFQRKVEGGYCGTEWVSCGTEWRCRCFAQYHGDRDAFTLTIEAAIEYERVLCDHWYVTDTSVDGIKDAVAVAMQGVRHQATRELRKLQAAIDGLPLDMLQMST